MKLILSLALIVGFVGVAWAKDIVALPSGGGEGVIFSTWIVIINGRDVRKPEAEYCVEWGSMTYTNPDCHKQWKYYRRVMGDVTDTFADLRHQPNCMDTVSQPCLKKLLLWPDGTVTWRKE